MIKEELLNEYKDKAREYLENVVGKDEYVEVTKGGDFNIYNCPECDQEQFVQYDKEKTAYVCLHCGIIKQATDINFCSVCGKLFYPVEPSQIICTECYEDKLNNKD